MKFPKFIFDQSGVTLSFTPRFRTPLLWRLTGLWLTATVKVMKLTGTVFTFTVSGETFTVSDETHRRCPVCAYVSFITYCKSYATDCKSENSACKFCQILQLVTITRTAIRLTVTRGGWLKLILYAPGGGRHTKSIFLFSFTPPPRGVRRGGWMKRFTGTLPSGRFCGSLEGPYGPILFEFDGEGYAINCSG